MKCTIEKEDPFIGQKLGKNKQLTVIGWAKEKIGSNRMYTLICDICSKDHELFPDGVFKAGKSNLVAGGAPCGCAESRKWTAHEYRVKIERNCTTKNIKFEGFSDPNERPHNNSKLKLNCLTCGNKWRNCSIGNLLRGVGCPCCAKLNSRANDYEMIKSFMASGNFLEGTEFSRVTNPNTDNLEIYWEYSCPKCSNDEYVQAGLCSGVFRKDSVALKAGSRACRCSKTHWSRDQREFQVKNLLEHSKYLFLGISENHSSVSGEVKLHCPEHGEKLVPLSRVVYSGSVCPACTENGYRRDKLGSFYVLRVSGSNLFTGFGISNVVKKRLKTHKNNLKKYGMVVEESEIFTGDGKLIFDLEKAIKKEFPLNSQTVTGFVTEATHYSLYNEVLCFARLYLENYLNRQ